jgi:hypothetical protein
MDSVFGSHLGPSAELSPKRTRPKPIKEKQLRCGYGCLEICADDDNEWLMFPAFEAFEAWEA